MSFRTSSLAQSPLFQAVSAHLTHDEKVQLAYRRAIAIGRAYRLSFFVTSSVNLADFP